MLPSAAYILNCSSTTMAILDSAGRVIAVLVGRPSNDPSWENVHLDAANELEAARSRCKFSKAHTNHRRGRFPALATGISHGGGQLRPGNLCHDSANRRVLDSLVQHPAFVRLAGFASGTASILLDSTPLSDLQGPSAHGPPGCTATTRTTSRL